MNISPPACYVIACLLKSIATCLQQGCMLACRVAAVLAHCRPASLLLSL
jgi:hypothetical protein